MACALVNRTTDARMKIFSLFVQTNYSDESVQSPLCERDFVYISLLLLERCVQILSDVEKSTQRIFLQGMSAIYDSPIAKWYCLAQITIPIRLTHAP